MEPKTLESGTYYHLGLKSTLLRTSENWLRKIHFTELKLQLNNDGLSLFKSSNQQLWPILGRIISPLVSNVFIVGIYGGEVKPSDFNMSAALTTELQELLTVGINVDKFHVHLTVKLVAVICDAPARSNVRYVVGHNATAGCDKCQVFGTRMSGRMTFPNGEHDLRNDVTFRSRSQSIHHRGRSSFENPPVGYQKCYGSEQLIYNVHSLKHIVEDVIEHGSLESFSAFPFESYMRKIRRSVHCGFAAAKQATQRYAEEVYFQSILNQDMADNVIEPEVTDDSSEQIVSYRNSKLSTTRPDNVVIAKGRPGFVTEIGDGGLIRFRPFHNSSDLYTDPFPSSNIDDYNVAQELKVCLTTVLGYNTNITTNDETQSCYADKPKRTVKRKNTDYLCTSEELEVAEFEAGFAPVEFPVFNILTGNFSPIARFVPTYQFSYSSSSKADVSSPPIPRTSTEGDKPLSDDTNHMFRIILKAVTELSSMMDRLIAVCERLAMGVSERRMEEKDSDAITFPLRAHDELRSLEAALDNQKFRDHFIVQDAVHGVIELESLAVQLIDSPEFQRLREIKQLGIAYFVFPSCQHSRFEHSIGTYHMAKKLLETIHNDKNYSGPALSSSEQLAIRIAALCHDLGHGPFSHLWEEFVKRGGSEYSEYNHETISGHVLYQIICSKPTLQSELNNLGVDMNLIRSLILGDTSTVLSQQVMP
ncbi:unnamed protein product [Schistosoma curassoni]|uniref:HD domain-containing protein n=1 Tax=Schistosoma curassoni TaxID=6186 RepID=A0A183K1F5_9TREM|nr:unnamed protein product [Schistosoma curassoni]